MKDTPENRVTKGRGPDMTRSSWEEEMGQHLDRGAGESLEGESQEMRNAK